MSELNPVIIARSDTIAKLSPTKLTPPITCSNYYRQANAIDASVRKQIALEIVLPSAVAALSGMKYRT